MNTAPSKFRTRNIVLAIVGLAIVAVAYQKLMHSSSADAGKYRTEAVMVTDLSSSISATGPIAATSTVDVGTQVSGTLQSVEVDFNETVQAGQIIARIDPATLQARVAQAEAALTMARAGLQEANASAASAENDAARKLQLSEQQYISRTERDSAIAQRDQTRARVISAQSQIKQQQANLHSAQVDLAKTIIRSPIQGTVLARNVEPGQTVAASLQTPVLFQIAGDLRKLEIILAIDESDIGQVAVGQAVQFTVDAYADKKFSGIVKQIRLAATNVSNVVTYPVVIEVSNNEQKLLPGMTATAQIIIQQKTNVLSIPSSALRFRPASVANAQTNAPANAQPDTEDRSKRMKMQLGSMREFLKSISASETVLNSFDMASTEYQKQMQLMMKKRMQGGASPGGAPMSSGGGDSGNRSKRLVERFSRAFESVRSQLTVEQQKKWDAQLQAMFSGKRATVYVLENGEASPVEIRLGVSDGSRVEVLSGLQNGQLLITGSERLKP